MNPLIALCVTRALRGSIPLRQLRIAVNRQQSLPARVMSPLSLALLRGSFRARHASSAACTTCSTARLPFSNNHVRGCVLESSSRIARPVMVMILMTTRRSLRAFPKTLRIIRCAPSNLMPRGPRLNRLNIRAPLKRVTKQKEDFHPHPVRPASK